IAHVDHGKTTLVDAMLRQTGGLMSKEQRAQDCLMDSNEIERERGITILAKNTSVPYGKHRINIVDTPGHADFGSEVERILRTVDGALLLVDVAEGPMPQTKYVLRKALERGLAPIVVLNKMDRPNADPHKALDATFDLFGELGATDEQLDFPVIYAAGRAGWASSDPQHSSKDLKPLFDTILKHVPGPESDPDQPLQMLVTMLDYSNFLGQIAIGRIVAGEIITGAWATLIRPGGSSMKAKVTRLLSHVGLELREIEKARAGDIVAVAGFAEVEVGSTIAAADNPTALPSIHIDAPTLSIEFQANDSPFAGKEGSFLTARHIKERLQREAQTNVGMRMEDLGQSVFKVSGRGELHLSFLIESMRREGFELAVSRPQVIYREENGVRLEPAELLVLDLETAHQGSVMQNLGERGARMKNMVPEGLKRLRLEYVIASRALMGFKQQYMTLTRGTGMMHHSFHDYVPVSGETAKKRNGALIALEGGLTTGYALNNLQERGILFLEPGIPVYAGMVIGEHSRENDITVNPCKQKHLSNMRSKAADEAIQLTPSTVLSLEQAIEFIQEDELLEVTPENLRVRKRILDHAQRKRAEKTA
ncbi:MAG: translational GTPase TypA, partial [Elusimicrobia bacterium]|nr:translational GTPase TypA [Elusimicrobiota bacterium]